MPDYSLMTGALGGDFDPENSGGRFNRRLAVAVLVPEYDWESYGSGPEATGRAVEARAGAWLLEEEPHLGKPRAVDGSVGRGAEGWIPVVEWAADAVGQGIVDLTLMATAAAILKRLRRRGKDASGDEAAKPVGFYISRGMAAAVAADDVANSFGDLGPLEVEAVEEPSGIMGVPVSETSYVGTEPWVVLLRNAEAERRYYVVVAPDGEIMGRIETPLLEWETMFLRPSGGDDA
jgi:hypothetical protein